MLALHYYSNAKGVRATLRKVTGAWWSEDDDPVYSKDLIKEFEVENPPLEDELAWILKKGIYFATHTFSLSLSLRPWYLLFLLKRYSFPTAVYVADRILTVSLSLSHKLKPYNTDGWDRFMRNCRLTC